MRKIYPFIFFVVLSGLYAHADPLSQRNDQVSLRLDNNIQLIIDERIELVCTVFRLAGAHEYINYQLFDYISEVDNFVYNNKDHPIISFIKQYYVKNLKTLWHTATYVYNSPLRCTLQHLADDIENS